MLGGSVVSPVLKVTGLSPRVAEKRLFDYFDQFCDPPTQAKVGLGNSAPFTTSNSASVLSCIVFAVPTLL